MNADNVAGSRAGESDALDTVAREGAGPAMIDALGEALRRGALPGELEGFTEENTREAADFIAACAARRPAGVALVRLELVGTQLGHRRMRIGIVNDDMPFLVDSIAGAIAARGLIIHRLLHPVVCVRRDEEQVLTAIEPLCDDAAGAKSIMYIEVDRADARTRAELLAELHQVLAFVRAAVTDWRAMQARMHADADLIEDEEGRALLHWFADGAMSLLGYHVERPTGQPTEALGIFKLPGEPTDEGGCMGAIRYFEAGGARAADGQGRPQVAGPPPGAARPGRRAGAREGQDHRRRRACRAVDEPGDERAGRGSAGASAPARGAGAQVRLRAGRP